MVIKSLAFPLVNIMFMLKAIQLSIVKRGLFVQIALHMNIVLHVITWSQWRTILMVLIFISLTKHSIPIWNMQIEKVWLTIAYLKGMYKVLLVSRGSLYQYPTLCCEIVKKSKDEILSMKWIKSSGGCSTNSTIKSTTRQNRSCEYCVK